MACYGLLYTQELGLQYSFTKNQVLVKALIYILGRYVETGMTAGLKRRCLAR